MIEGLVEIILELSLEEVGICGGYEFLKISFQF